MIEENAPLTQEQINQFRETNYNATHPASWVWDETAVSWVAPVPLPNDGFPYLWDEKTLSWTKVPGFPYD